MINKLTGGRIDSISSKKLSQGLMGTGPKRFEYKSTGKGPKIIFDLTKFDSVKKSKDGKEEVRGLKQFKKELKGMVPSHNSATSYERALKAKGLGSNYIRTRKGLMNVIWETGAHKLNSNQIQRSVPKDYSEHLLANHTTAILHDSLSEHKNAALENSEHINVALGEGRKAAQTSVDTHTDKDIPGFAGTNTSHQNINPLLPL